MFDVRFWNAGIDQSAKMAAIERSQATIEFDMNGVITSANQNFLDVMGYTFAEIRGQPHSMFVEPSYAASAEYGTFWAHLKRGEYQASQFKRIGKGGKEVWIQGSYNPVLDRRGKPLSVIKIATDITASKLLAADMTGQVDAIGKSQAVIQFNMDGTVLSANQNFLDVLGYSLQEVRGKHHRMFVEPAARESSDYQAFWAKLNRGEYQAAQFKRIGKGGREVWIQASYNPIFDLNGKPSKVVKFATDITAQVKLLADLKALLDQNFGEISGAIKLSAGQARLATDAVQTTSGQVQTMAAGTEELAASVREIAGMMERSSAATESAYSQTSRADEAIKRLSDTSTAMGGIVELIRSIAGQINLLALNATIEAARAGDAGKGFAVVAGEVKNLAQQAASATNQIASEINQLQSVSTGVVEALTGIAGSIDSLRQFTAASASAVEQQSVVTQELSSSMQSAATTVMAINDNMAQITAAVSQVEHAVNGTQSAARVLVR